MFLYATAPKKGIAFHLILGSTIKMRVTLVGKARKREVFLR